MEIDVLISLIFSQKIRRGSITDNGSIHRRKTLTDSDAITISYWDSRKIVIRLQCFNKSGFTIVITKRNCVLHNECFSSCLNCWDFKTFIRMYPCVLWETSSGLNWILVLELVCWLQAHSSMAERETSQSLPSSNKSSHWMINFYHNIPYFHPIHHHNTSIRGEREKSCKQVALGLSYRQWARVSCLLAPASSHVSILIDLI